MSNPSDNLPEDARPAASPAPDETSVPSSGTTSLPEGENAAAARGLPSYMRSPEDASADNGAASAQGAPAEAQNFADGRDAVAASASPDAVVPDAVSSDTVVSDAVPSDAVDRDTLPAHSTIAVEPDGEAFPLPEATDAAPAYGPIAVSPDGEAFPPPDAASDDQGSAWSPPSGSSAPAGQHGFAAPLHEPDEKPGREAAGEASRQAAPETSPGPDSAKRGIFSSGKKDTKKPAAKASAPRPSLPAFHRTHPVLITPQNMPPSVWSRFFNGMALLPLLPLTVLLLLQVLFTLDARGLWYLDEVRYAGVFQNLLQHGQGVVLSLDGAVYTDKPPLYFWFLRGLYELIGSNAPLLLFVGTAVSALLYLWSALGLGRLACRVDGRTNSAAGIILLSSIFIMGAVHAAGMDMLFAALVVCSHIALYRAFVAPGAAYPGMILAFVLAGLATLVNGLLGLLLPVGSIVLFALWRGSAAQARCICISTAALLLGLAPFWGPPVLQAFGLLPEAQALPLFWGLAVLALPVLLLLAAIKFLPDLRLCAALSLLLLVALFVLSGGTPEVGFPLLYVLPGGVAALFLLWQATPQRLFRPDFYIGIAAGLAVIGLWPAAIYLLTGNLDFILHTLPQKYVLDPILGTGSTGGLWPFYLLRLLLLLLPWTLLLFFLPWHRLLGRNARQGLAASRRPEKEGLAFLWCMSIAALVLLSFVSAKNSLYLLPVLPALALLAGRAVLGLEDRRALLFRLGMAAFLFLAGVLTVIFALMLFGILPMPLPLSLHFPWTLPSHGGFFVAGALLLLFGALIWLGLSSSRPEGVLALAAIAAACLGYPLGAMIAAPMDPYRSPEAQALMLRAYAKNNYAPVAYKVEPGVYSYYSGYTVRQMPSLADAAALAAQPQAKVVLALPVAELDAWNDKPEGLSEVHRQWLGPRQFALLASPALEGLAPAQPPFTPAPNLFEPIYKLLGITPGRKPAPPAPAAAPAVQPDVPAPGKDTPSTAPEDAGATDAQPAGPAVETPEPVPAPAAPTEEPAGTDAPDAAPTPSDAPPAEAASPEATPEAEAKAGAPAEDEAKPEASPAESKPEESAPDAGTHPAAADSSAPAETGQPSEEAGNSAEIPDGAQTTPSDAQGAAGEESAPATPEQSMEPAGQPAAPAEPSAPVDEAPVEPSSEGAPVPTDAPQDADATPDAAPAHGEPSGEADSSANAPDEARETPSAAPSPSDTDAARTQPLTQQETPQP